MLVRGIRGATTVEENSAAAIHAATKELLGALIAANQIKADMVASAWFTTTPDLDAAFPAAVAREMGWQHVAMLCAHEMAVPSGLPMCLRILIHVNTEKTPDQILHVYLRGAQNLKARADALLAEAANDAAGEF